MAALPKREHPHGHSADADHGQLPGKSVSAISTSRYLPFVHGLDASTASDPHAPIFIAPAKLLSFKFALYPDRTQHHPMIESLIDLRNSEKGRWYRLEVGSDLFGQKILIKRWG